MSCLRSLVLLVLFTAGCGTGCDQEAATQRLADETEAEAAPDQVSQDVRFTVHERDRPRVSIEAARMERFVGEDSTYTVLDRAPGGAPVQAYLFDEAGDSSAVLTSDRLFFFEADDWYEAEGEVVVETIDGKVLRSEHLSWRASERKVRTPGFVRITTPEDRIEGYGLVADEDLSSYQLSDVTGQTTMEEQ